MCLSVLQQYRNSISSVVLAFTYPPKTVVRNNESSLSTPARHLPVFCYFEYFMEKPVLEAIASLSSIPTNQKSLFIQQTVIVLFINTTSRYFLSKVKHRKMLNKSYKINTMQLSFIALSLVFSLVSKSYKLSVKKCLRCAFQVKKCSILNIRQTTSKFSTWCNHGIGKNNFK